MNKWHGLKGLEPTSCGFGDRRFTIKLNPYKIAQYSFTAVPSV